MNKKLIQRIEEIFQAKLMTKTGWSRNDVMIAYKEAVAEACLEFID